MNACLLWLLSYKQQSLAYSNICYLLWSHVEHRIDFFSKPFHNTLNNASTANIEEVMIFYNLGDNFETDFNLNQF